MSAFALRASLTWNSVGMLELFQKLTHFTLATGGEVFFGGGKQPRQVAGLQMLFKCLGIEDDSVRLAVLRKDDWTADLVDVVDNLSCVALQISN
jgi:hypothetical protein